MYFKKIYDNESGLNFNYTINKIIKSKIPLYIKKTSKKELECILVEINELDFSSKTISINLDNRMKCLINNICTGYYDR